MKKIKNSLREFERKRKKHTRFLELFLLKSLVNNKNKQKELIEKSQVKRVLIVRNNTRIGNIVFLLPFLNKLKEVYPNAKIDLLLNEPWQENVFKNININKIYYSHFRFKSLFLCLKQLKQLKKENYDLCFIPFRSSSDRVVSSFISSKNFIAQKNKENDYLYTHTFDVDEDSFHYALKPLHLFKYQEEIDYKSFNPHLQLSIEEIQEAKKSFFLYKNNSKKYTITYFRGARGAKVIADELWLKNLEKLKAKYNDEIDFIEILSPDIKKPLSIANKTYSNKNLRVLASFLKQTDLFICLDTGPLHLASAAGVNCLGIYSKTNIKTYGTLGKNSKNTNNFENFYEEVELGKLIS